MSEDMGSARRHTHMSDHPNWQTCLIQLGARREAKSLLLLVLYVCRSGKLSKVGIVKPTTEL